MTRIVPIKHKNAMTHLTDTTIISFVVNSNLSSLGNNSSVSPQILGGNGRKFNLSSGLVDPVGKLIVPSFAILMNRFEVVFLKTILHVSLVCCSTIILTTPATNSRL
jgi:hypothetical protein